ncbi:hypothetical protein AVEN_212985-1, partial [Araneus ventricosus]
VRKGYAITACCRKVSLNLCIAIHVERKFYKCVVVASCPPAPNTRPGP